MLTGAVVAIAVTMLLALVRALLGPSVYDRVLAVNMFGTKTVLLLAIVAFVAGRDDYLDLALAYALINFIGVLAVLEFFHQRKFGHVPQVANGSDLQPPENEATPSEREP